MTKPQDPASHRPKARETRSKPERVESTTPSKASTPAPEQTRKGGENSEGGGAGTGAGATFSGSRIRGGGSDVPVRGQRRPVAGVAQDAEGAQAENAEAAPGASLAVSGQSAVTQQDPRRVIGGHTWAPDPGGDPGPGFYRFRKADIPNLDARQGSGMGTVIECFGRNLAEAQLQIGMLVAKAKRGTAVRPVDIRPSHYRRTRLSKKQRRETGA